MPTSTIITFAGLLVFRRDLNTGQYEVGTLRARDAHDSHILQIEISPDPSTGQGLLVIPPDDLERHIRDGNVVWQLEVEGSPSPGIQATPGKPNDRKNPTTSNDKDLGWIVNLENDEFHNGPLTRTPNALQPIIGLQQGILFTSCKTDSVVTIQGDFAQDFGFITGGISLTIDTSAGQKPELNVFDQQGTKV